MKTKVEPGRQRQLSCTCACTAALHASAALVGGWHSAGPARSCRRASGAARAGRPGAGHLVCLLFLFIPGAYSQSPRPIGPRSRVRGTGPHPLAIILCRAAWL